MTRITTTTTNSNNNRKKLSTTTTTTTTTTTSTTTTTTHVPSLLLLGVVVVTTLQVTDAEAFQYNPCRRPDQSVSQLRRDMIPSDFRIKTNCIAPIIDELCKNSFPDVDAHELGPEQEFNRGIPQCIGASCSIDCLHYTFCDKQPDMEMPETDVPQEEMGVLPERMNAYPACDRYLQKMNKTVIKKAGRSCWGQLQCTCGICCDSSDERTVMMTMLERTYNDLQTHLQSQRKFIRRRPLRPLQGTAEKPRVAGYRYDSGK